MKTLVLAIGNTLLTDEGAGIHALQVLQEQHPEPVGVTYMDGGTLSFTLAGAVEDADNLIVLDATQLKSEPGTVDCLINEEMDRFLGNCKRSVHEIGLLDLLDISRLTDNLPKRRALVAIQPDVIDWGEYPTEQVAAAIPLVVDKVLALMEKWSITPGADEGQAA
ncbi:MAG: HyaD/HybD family hydrogenase maturation endopeptidase [Arenicellales bacterium]